ncbi:hypothetical protein GEMRC1_003678 [Eukaryota sp. GEM-RC1]
MDSILLLPISILLLNTDAEQKSSVALVIGKTVLKSPIILSVIVGVLTKLIVPQQFLNIDFIHVTLTYFSNCVTGGLLVVIGMSFYLQIYSKDDDESAKVPLEDDPKDLKFLIYLFFLRLILSPLIMVLIGDLLFNLKDQIYDYAQYSVSLPVAIACFSVSKRFKKVLLQLI